MINGTTVLSSSSVLGKLLQPTLARLIMTQFQQHRQLETMQEFQLQLDSSWDPSDNEEILGQKCPSIINNVK